VNTRREEVMEIIKQLAAQNFILQL